MAVGRRAARAILIDDECRLVLIKRTKPGQAPYWTAPGGGVEDSDASAEAALYRELAEELGAKATDASQVLDRVDLRGDDLASIDLKPTALKDFILANREALLVEATVAA